MVPKCMSAPQRVGFFGIETEISIPETSSLSKKQFDLFRDKGAPPFQESFVSCGTGRLRMEGLRIVPVGIFFYISKEKSLSSSPTGEVLGREKKYQTFRFPSHLDQ